MSGLLVISLILSLQFLLLTIAIGAGALSVLTVVPAGHVGVPVIFGRVQDRGLGEGLNFVNPFAVVHRLTVRTETYTMSAVHDEGQVKGDDSIRVLSRRPDDASRRHRGVPRHRG